MHSVIENFETTIISIALFAKILNRIIILLFEKQYIYIYIQFVMIMI